MKIMIDTTVFLAECLLPTQKYPKVFRKIVSDCILVIPTRQIEEIRSVMAEFFPEEGDTVELFLSRFSYETVENAGRARKVYPFLGEAKKAGVSKVITLDPELTGTIVEEIEFIGPDDFLKGDCSE